MILRRAIPSSELQTFYDMKYLLSLLLFPLSICMNAQNLFYNLQSDPYSSFSNSIVTGENFILSNSFTVISSDLSISTIKKFTTDGNVTDSLILDDSVYNCIVELIPVNDTFLGVGTQYSTNSALYYLWIVFFDKNLNILNENKYDFSPHNIGLLSYCLDPDSNIVLFGCSIGQFVDYDNNFIFNISTEGDSIQFKWFNNSGVDYAYDILPKIDQTGYYTFESSHSGIVPNEIHVLDNNFNLEKIILGPHLRSNKNCALYLNDTTIIYSTLKDYSTIPSQTDFGVIMIDTNGTVFNEFLYGKPDTTIQLPPSTNLDSKYKDKIFVAGIININISNNSVTPCENSWIVINQLDSTLNLNWQRFIGGDNFYMLWDLIATDDGGCLLAGSKYDLQNPVNQMDAFIAKIGSNGEFLSHSELPKPIPDILLFPNPGGNFLNIRVSGPIEKATLNVLDIQGKLLKMLNLNYGDNQINTSELKSGTYILQIENDNKILLTTKWIKKE